MMLVCTTTFDERPPILIIYFMDMHTGIYWANDKNFVKTTWFVGQ